ncbi:MAG: 50S ribosomal protein L10 [Elusimicrobiaceae bacterium]|jgi:large subunit ribosomal protein L10|nr:50S ribosomal protein L10 [Elusimicrobiaceae bacterium]MBT4402492.1 50S ribosomal protein L10 [Elusimicrobiaceae bacterium]MBT4440144.1 50S ribosomal protein L10 [Elusimicrobiaceae bacterium]MBT5988080.1 50S ribosomal protein L10 [Elusimicrobiaceae bacterium]MBT6715121.1 50S ribosomal protein L10 [Elusimicrobiaceae bacterium]
MKLSKDNKKDKSKGLATDLKAASGIFFTSFQGLKFVEISELREKLSPLNCKFKVERNSILDHAFSQSGIKDVEEKLLKGPTAIGLLKEGDVAEAAKVFSDFAKSFEALKIKACYADGNWFTESDVKKLATLGSKQDNIAKFAGALYSSVSQIASVMQAPIRDFAFVLNAVQEQKAKA